MSTGVARIIARSRKRGEARYGTAGKEEEPSEEDWPGPVGRAGSEERREEAKKKVKKKKELRKEAAR